MKLSYFIRLFSLILALCMAQISNATPLLEVPVAKATIGVVPYYIHNKQVYVLLGRENINGIKGAAPGTFCDFGGSVLLDGSTFVQNALRELKEESMGQIVLSETELLTKSKVLYKEGKNGRKIYYLFYPFSEQEYARTLGFNKLRTELKQQDTPAAYLEKDQFYWFELQDILAQKSQVHDIDGNTHGIQLRDFFVKDCILHPDFPVLGGKLNANAE